MSTSGSLAVSQEETNISAEIGREYMLLFSHITQFFYKIGKELLLEAHSDVV